MKNHFSLIQPINVLSAKIRDLLTSHTTLENSLNVADEMSERDKRKSTQSSTDKDTFSKLCRLSL